MKLTVEVHLTPRELAQAFCDMNDETQAQFFIEAAAIARDWPDPAARVMQWNEVGNHLRDCKCSTFEARDMVITIADAIRGAA